MAVVFHDLVVGRRLHLVHVVAVRAVDPQAVAAIPVALVVVPILSISTETSAVLLVRAARMGVHLKRNPASQVSITYLSIFIVSPLVHV